MKKLYKVITAAALVMPTASFADVFQAREQAAQTAISAPAVIKKLDAGKRPFEVSSHSLNKIRVDVALGEENTIFTPFKNLAVRTKYTTCSAENAGDCELTINNGTLFLQTSDPATMIITAYPNHDIHSLVQLEIHPVKGIDPVITSVDWQASTRGEEEMDTNKSRTDVLTDIMTVVAKNRQPPGYSARAAGVSDDKLKCTDDNGSPLFIALKTVLEPAGVDYVVQVHEWNNDSKRTQVLNYDSCFSNDHSIFSIAVEPKIADQVRTSNDYRQLAPGETARVFVVRPPVGLSSTIEKIF